MGAGEKQRPLEENAGKKTIEWLNKLRHSSGSLPTSSIRLNMQRIMQNNAAVFRTQETLEEGKVDERLVLTYYSEFRALSHLQRPPILK